LNIAITGASGFLGTHLIRCLADRNKITAIDIKRSDFKDKVDFVQCDLRDISSLKDALSTDIDLVIHCAALIKIQSDGRCPTDLLDINLQSTVNLMEAMVDKGIDKMIFCSSMTVYSPDNSSPVNENSKLDPIHFYGMSKKWCEEAISAYASKGLIKALVLRYPGLYGYPRSCGYIYNVAKKLIAKQPVLVDSTGLKFWETIYVEDAAMIAKSIIENYNWDKNFEAINGSYGQEVDFVETAIKIKNALVSSSAIEVKEPKDYVKFYLDNTKLKNIMGSFDYDFDSGLKRFLNEHKEWIRQ